MSNALISIKPENVKMILCGEKSIEIRNRPVNLAPGTRLWIYSTLPSGCLEAVATVKLIKFDSPSTIWKDYCNLIGISHKRFRSYVNGSTGISAIFLQHVRKLKPSLTLHDLRSEVQDFHPPQFLKRMRNVNPILHLIKMKRVKLTSLHSFSVTDKRNEVNGSGLSN